MLLRQSGIAPKKGKQYGAPFREEDWDKDLPDGTMRNQVSMGDQSKEYLQGPSIDR